MRRALATALLLMSACVPPAAEQRPTPGQPRPVATSARLVLAAGNPAVGGTVLPTGGTIATGIATAPTLATLSRAVTAANLALTLAGPGPFTLFAPTDEAWGRLAPGTVETLLKPENRASLVRMLDLHLVAGTLGGAELMRRIQAGSGRATLPTLEGEPLLLTMTGNIVTLTDGGGNKSYVEVSDVRAANGVIHVVNGVLVPRLP